MLTGPFTTHFNDILIKYKNFHCCLQTGGHFAAGIINNFKIAELCVTITYHRCVLFLKRHGLRCQSCIIMKPLFDKTIAARCNKFHDVQDSVNSSAKHFICDIIGIMSYHTLLYYIVLFCFVLNYIVLRCIILCYVLSCHVIPCHVMSYHIISYHCVMWCDVMS